MSWPIPKHNWTDERTERLRQMCADGLSAAQMADELGGVTRNAILGKAHRLRISLTPAAGRPRKSPKPRFIKPSRLRSLPPQATDLPSEHVANPVTLLELNEHTCRYPIGDPQSPDFVFCGGMPLYGCPYCARHAAIAYQRPGSQQDRGARELLIRRMAKMRGGKAA